MSTPRALDDEAAQRLERWYSEVECLGTVEAKCKELGIGKATFYDTIRRVRGQATKYEPKRKAKVDISALIDSLGTKDPA